MNGRVTTIVRRPSTTVFETSVTDVARRSPGQCSASEPHVPIFCSKTPDALAISVYGASAMFVALSPTPNHTSAGPVIASVATPAPAAAVVSSVSANVTLTIDVAWPTRVAPGVQPPAPAVL